MDKKTVTLIAAMARNRAIGLKGDMPWRLPGELQHFKRTTMGKPIVMGRKTWDGIGRPLPGRQNIVVTRNRAFSAEGCDIANSLKEALRIADGEEVMIAGGGELYRMALPLASRMVLTMVDCEPEADTWFPEWPEDDWREVSREYHAADEKNEYSFEIVEMVKREA